MTTVKAKVQQAVDNTPAGIHVTVLLIVGILGGQGGAAIWDRLFVNHDTVNEQVAPLKDAVDNMVTAMTTLNRTIQLYGQAIQENRCEIEAIKTNGNPNSCYGPVRLP